jgi:hypothetical protein
MKGTTAATRLLVPSLAVIVTAEGMALSLPALGFDTRGFTWLVAALVAGFSLSGSV